MKRLPITYLANNDKKIKKIQVKNDELAEVERKHNAIHHSSKSDI